MTPIHFEFSEEMAAIDRLKELQPGWDSYGADQIATSSIEEAKRIVREVQRALGPNYARPIVGPTPDSGVALIWRKKGEGEVDVLVSPTSCQSVVLSRTRDFVEKGPITDYEAFAREVIKRHVSL